MEGWKGWVGGCGQKARLSGLGGDQPARRWWCGQADRGHFGVRPRTGRGGKGVVVCAVPCATRQAASQPTCRVLSLAHSQAWMLPWMPCNGP